MVSAWTLAPLLTTFNPILLLHSVPDLSLINDDWGTFIGPAISLPANITHIPTILTHLDTLRGMYQAQHNDEGVQWMEAVSDLFKKHPVYASNVLPISLNADIELTEVLPDVPRTAKTILFLSTISYIRPVGATLITNRVHALLASARNGQSMSQEAYAFLSNLIAAHFPTLCNVDNVCAANTGVNVQSNSNNGSSSSLNDRGRSSSISIYTDHSVSGCSSHGGGYYNYTSPSAAEMELTPDADWPACIINDHLSIDISDGSYAPEDAANHIFVGNGDSAVDAVIQEHTRANCFDENFSMMSEYQPELFPFDGIITRNCQEQGDYGMQHIDINYGVDPQLLKSEGPPMDGKFNNNMTEQYTIPEFIANTSTPQNVTTSSTLAGALGNRSKDPSITKNMEKANATLGMTIPPDYKFFPPKRGDHPLPTCRLVDAQSECGFKVEDLVAFKKHMKTHRSVRAPLLGSVNEMVFRCTWRKCGGHNKSPRGMRRHVREIHMSRLQCPFCGQLLEAGNRLPQLEKHVNQKHRTTLQKHIREEQYRIFTNH